MKIQAGLFDNMVLQRDRCGRCNTIVRGECSFPGRLRATVARNGKLVPGMKGKVIGQIRGGRLLGHLQGLSVGGAYNVELVVTDPTGKRVLDRKLVKNVLVGDVWILAGQSNMVGSGALLAQAAKSNPNVRAFYMHDQWGVARDPIHNVADSMDPVHNGRADGRCSVRRGRPGLIGAGPGVAFGQEMFRCTRIPQGLIACAQSATSLSGWDPALKHKGGHSLYGAMFRRFAKNGGRVAGLVWYQGCAEASPERAPLYTPSMCRFLETLRRDFRCPRLPVVMAQIARVCGSTDARARFWNSVQDQQRRLPEKMRGLSVVPAIDLEIEDGIHLAGRSSNRLGVRLAQAMCVLRGVRGAGLPPIELGAIQYGPDPVRGMLNVTVAFRNVTGKLRAQDIPQGFSIRQIETGNELLFRTRLCGQSAILNTALAPNSLARLYYGYGAMPFCNITDQADRSLPMFGPIEFGKLVARMPFVRQLRMSRALPPTGNMKTLRYPAARDGLELKTRRFPTDFLDLRKDLFACPPKDVMVYFACDLICPEPMELSAGLGYDGPLKIWVDRKMLFCDPNGTNPANADKIGVPFKVRRGRHAVLIALGSNYGRAWGIRLRFQRNDLAPDVLKKGPQAYRLPKIIG